MAGTKLIVALIPIVVIVACSDVQDNSPATDCVANWTDPTGQFECPTEATVSCDQATRCYVTLDECQASGECGATNPGTGGTPGTSMCDPNWTDPSGQLSCPDGLPVSCDQATQCWDTVANCEAAGQCM